MILHTPARLRSTLPYYTLRMPPVCVRVICVCFQCSQFTMFLVFGFFILFIWFGCSGYGLSAVD